MFACFSFIWDRIYLYRANTCLWHRDNLKITIFIQREITMEYYK